MKKDDKRLLMELEIKEKVETVNETQKRSVVIRYAYASEQYNTYIISKTKKQYFGFVLLFKLTCEITSDEIFTPDNTKPIVGSVVCDTHGLKLKVIQCDWI